MRQEIINTGTLNIRGREYHLQTIYPMGRKRPQYQLWYVWENTEPGQVFASEDGFVAWLTRMEQPTQMPLL